MNFLKPKALAPKMQSASDGPLVWIDCEASLTSLKKQNPANTSPR